MMRAKKWFYFVSVFVLLALTRSVSADLVAHWTFNNDGSDSVGSAHCSLQNGAAYVTDSQEGSHSLSLDGIDDYAIPAASGVLYDPFREETVAIWFKANSTGGTHVIYNEGGWTNGLSLRIYDNSLSTNDIEALAAGIPRVPARDPSPANGSRPDIEGAMHLAWSGGDLATQHNVYFGTDALSVEAADASDTTGIYQGRQSTTSYPLADALAWGTGPYYWRIDEIDQAGAIRTGRIWSFLVADYLIVDDFESYNDIDEGEEATMAMTGTASDWTRQDVAELSLWFRGESTNAAEPMYVALNGIAVYHDNPDAVQIGAYEEWVIPLQTFADQGVSLNNVTRIAIGFGTPGNTVAGGAGTIYIDDIRLYRPRTH